MNTIPQNVRQEFWKMVYGAAAMQQVVKICDFMIQQEMDNSDPIYYPLVTALHTLYARPFRKSYGLGKPYGEDIVPKTRHATHRVLLDHRDKLFAHTDPLNENKERDGNETELNRPLWPVKEQNSSWATSVEAGKKMPIAVARGDAEHVDQSPEA